MTECDDEEEEKEDEKLVFVCPCCQACYVGQTSRHLLYRLREHKRKNSPVGEHFQKCNSELTMENVKVIASTFKSINYLMTLEALL